MSAQISADAVNKRRNNIGPKVGFNLGINLLALPKNKPIKRQ